MAANRDADERAQENLLSGARIVKKLVENRGELLARVADPLAEDPTFNSAFQRGDTRALTAELTSRAVMIAADIALVIDANGKPVAATGNLMSGDANFQQTDK